MSNAETTGIQIVWRLILAGLRHAEGRGGYQCHNGRANPLEDAFYVDIVFEIMEE